MLSTLLDLINSVSVTDDIVDQAVALRKQYNLKIADTIIAATAVTKNLELVTRNVKDFCNIKELNIFNPFDP